MNKKIIQLIISIFILCNFWTLDADESTPSISSLNSKTEECSIENWPSILLYKYTENVSNIISNITKQIIEIQKKQKELWNNTNLQKQWLNKDKSILSSQIRRIWNTLSDWDWYQDYFDFYVTLPLKTEIPYQIMRDYNIIKKESKRLEDYQKLLIKKWYASIIVWDICNNINFYKCKWNVTDVIQELLIVNNILLEQYRASMLWKDYEIDKDKKDYIIKFIDLELFNTIYHKNLIKECSLKDWTWKRIKEGIQDIANWNKIASLWLQEWKDAIDMLNMTWNYSWEHWEAHRKKILEKELKRQWLSTEATSKILNNLEQHEKCLKIKDEKEKAKCLSKNNLISNSLWAIEKATEELKKELREIYQKFKKLKNSKEEKILLNWWNKNTSINNINKDINNEKIKKEIELELKEMQLINSKLIEIPDLSTKKLEWRIIDSHRKLSKAIQNLNEAIPYSEKVCNKQAGWLGICTTK